jgi:hypothetical protein
MNNMSRDMSAIVGSGENWYELRVDNDNRFASFFEKIWLQTSIFFREKIMRLSRESLFRDNKFGR